MKIELKHIKIADLVKGYQNKNEDGVVGYDGKLEGTSNYPLFCVNFPENPFFA